MSLTKEQKESVISKFARSPNDTGSSEVQIALTTKRIAEISAHLEQHKKDLHSRFGLIKLLSARRRLLDYLKKDNQTRYKQILQGLGLRK
ncbi:MAG: 30S ribosomal protein S15 [Alphaproteobacteria bacterium 40-19]|nr:MAG: 30S ribosomal protein S15 [Alphaproteobacteria bacterium 40-19]